MARSQLAIHTSVLERLVKEEKSYHKEQQSQEKRISDLENSTDTSDENRDFKLKQEKKALDETKAVLPSMREKIANAREILQALLSVEGNDAGEVEKAKKALKAAIEAQSGDPSSARPEGEGKRE